MPKLKATTFRVRASSQEYATLDFSGERGRSFQIQLPSAALPSLIHHLANAAHEAPRYLAGIQANESTRNSTQSGVRLDVHEPKKFVPGPHGGFQLGTSIDLSRVFMTIHVPALGAIDFLMGPQTAKELLNGLAQMIALIESEHVETQQ